MNHIIPESHNINEHILFRLAPLIKATVVHRPSKRCKTPYAADVILDISPYTCDVDNTYIAHSPSLGCCGLCNTDSVVFIQPTHSNTNKCSHRIMLSSIKLERENDENCDTIYIATHPRLAEDVVKYALSLDLIDELKGHVQQYTKEQVSFGTSRFDFAGITVSGRPFLLEVKCVPLADYEDIPSRERINKIKKNHYDGWNKYNKVAYFPDGYRKNKTDVVSPRALKHIEELTEIALKGDIDTYMCFVIQRSDVSRFVISCIDPIYRRAVKKAIETGVKMITLQCNYDGDGVCRLINQDILDMSCFTNE
jgi:DNA-binding sugar fermentation-stimulating protein